MSCIEVPRPAYGAAPPRWHTTWPVLTCRQATRTSQSEVIGISRISCTTRATSPSRKINPASVAIQASSPAYAALPTTSCAAIRPDRSARIDTLPLFPDPRLYPSGASVESVEQPWGGGGDVEVGSIVVDSPACARGGSGCTDEQSPVVDGAGCGTVAVGGCCCIVIRE